MPSKYFLWRFPQVQKESAMDRIREALQGDLFAREVPLPAPAQRALLPLVAALITAVMTSTHPPTVQTGGDDDDS